MSSPVVALADIGGGCRCSAPPLRRSLPPGSCDRTVAAAISRRSTLSVTSWVGSSRSTASRLRRSRRRSSGDGDTTKVLSRRPGTPIASGPGRSWVSARNATGSPPSRCSWSSRGASSATKPKRFHSTTCRIRRTTLGHSVKGGNFVLHDLECRHNRTIEDTGPSLDYDLKPGSPCPMGTGLSSR